MRNRIIYILATLTIAITAFAVSTHPIHAQTVPGTGTPSAASSASGAGSSGNSDSEQIICDVWNLNLRGCLYEGMANLADLVLKGVSSIVAIAGSIMSFTIVLTLHIKDFVDATPAIFQVWTTLRDVTSLFFIFFLLWAAFKIILGMDSKIGELIKNLVMAGILINFSFFLVGIMIDASNIVSQALYNAMVPTSVTTAAVNDIKTGNINDMLQNVTGMNPNSLQNSDGSKYGISDIFRNALKLSSFQGGVAPDSKTIGDPFKIFLIAIVGIIIMITAALSFLAAAAAFIVRLVILLFLLAVSPLWFASWIIPKIKEEFNFMGKLIPQLTFMPIYLLLMYVGLKVIAGSNLLAAANAKVAGANAATNWIFSYIILSINFAIVIVILNLPLMVALAMSGNLGKTGWLSKFDAGNIWKNVGNWSRRTAYQGTVSRAASAISRSEGLKDFASRQGLVGGLGRLTLKGVRNTASDYDKKLASQVKERTEFAESLGYNEKAVSRAEAMVRRLKQRESYYKDMGTDAGNENAKRVKALYSALETRITNKKKERQASYAKDLEKKGLISAAPNIWMKVSRKDKVAAAKINVGVWQKQLDQKKKDLDEVKTDIKSLEKDIQRQDGRANDKQSAKLAELQEKRTKLTSNPRVADPTTGIHNYEEGDISSMGVNELQDLIDKAKLTK